MSHLDSNQLGAYLRRNGLPEADIGRLAARLDHSRPVRTCHLVEGQLLVPMSRHGGDSGWMRLIDPPAPAFGEVVVLVTPIIVLEAFPFALALAPGVLSDGPYYYVPPRLRVHLRSATPPAPEAGEEGPAD